MILVDSSIYIDSFRQRVDLLRILEPWIRAQELFSCGVVRAEVVRGILNPHQKMRVIDLFDVLQEIPTDAKLWNQVSELAWQLDRSGITLPLTNVVIATCAMRVGATVITLDKHFWKVPGLKVRKNFPEWV